MSTERTYLKLHTHQSLESKCARRGSPYRTMVVIGGVRSGKTLTIAKWIIDRSKWDTAQYHGLFAYTGPQLHSAILAEVLPWLEMGGMASVWNRKPPAAWYEKWRKQGIKLPPRLKKYTNFLIFDTGLHVYCGTLFNKSYQQVRGMKLGSVVIEEFTAGPSEEGVRFVFERVNCGIGKAKCREQHQHTRILHGNPPENGDHWIYDWLARFEAQAAKKAGETEKSRGEIESESYPHLLNGKGDVIYIPSRTLDNIENLPPDYIDDIANVVDEETAKRVLHGLLTRNRSGRVYSAYSQRNQIRVEYDPQRTLWVSLDFNGNPLAGILAQPLRAGEFPSENAAPGIRHVGVFGELFHVGGSDTTDLCQRLLDGDAGNQGHFPKSFRGLLEHRGPIIFFGDATSAYAKTAGNDWQIVDKVIGEAITKKREQNAREGRGDFPTYGRDVPEHNSYVAVGVHAVQAKLRSATGIISLWIDLDLEELPSDLLTVIWDRTGKDVQKYGQRGGGKLWLRTHLSDALRYLIDRLFHMGREVETAPKDMIPKVPTREFHEPRM